MTSVCMKASLTLSRVWLVEVQLGSQTGSRLCFEIHSFPNVHAWSWRWTLKIYTQKTRHYKTFNERCLLLFTRQLSGIPGSSIPKYRLLHVSPRPAFLRKSAHMTDHPKAEHVSALFCCTIEATNTLLCASRSLLLGRNPACDMLCDLLNSQGQVATTRRRQNRHEYSRRQSGGG